MNGKERTEAVMRGDRPDRVPVSCQLSMGYIIKNSGVSPSEFYLKYNKIGVDAAIDLTKNIILIHSVSSGLESIWTTLKAR
jgi:hypothetical protein